MLEKELILGILIASTALMGVSGVLFAHFESRLSSPMENLVPLERKREKKRMRISTRLLGSSMLIGLMAILLLITWFESPSFWELTSAKLLFLIQVFSFMVGAFFPRFRRPISRHEKRRLILEAIGLFILSVGLRATYVFLGEVIWLIAWIVVMILFLVWGLFRLGSLI